MIEPASPLVSVIIPAFNRATTLPRAITSCLNQTLKDLEVIVIDDGSTDHTAAVVRNLPDPRVRLLQHATNDGAAKARNTGIANARAPYVAFLDSDDEWLPQKLEKQLQLFDQCENPDNLVVYCEILQYRRPSIWNVVPRRAKLEHETFSEYTFEHGGLIHTIGMVLPYSLALQCKFDETLLQHQDYDFCIRLEAHGVDFRCVTEPLAVWYNHERRGRVSVPKTSRPSWVWYDKHKESLEPATRLFFLARNVGPLSVVARPCELLGLMLSVAQSRKIVSIDLLRLVLYLLFGRFVVKLGKDMCLYLQQKGQP